MSSLNDTLSIDMTFRRNVTSIRYPFQHVTAAVSPPLLPSPGISTTVTLQLSQGILPLEVRLLELFCPSSHSEKYIAATGEIAQL